MKQNLTLSFRPKTLDGMVGANKFTRRLRKQLKKRLPKLWMLMGETGCGKTTIARIIAKSLQCTHQSKNEWGNPCKDCRARGGFDIVEINAGDITGIDALREAISGSEYEPRPGSKYRVYIIDEAHQLSKHAQTLLLKYTEDHSARTTIYIICTTGPEKIINTLRGRAYKLTVPGLTRQAIRVLVKRVLKFAGENLDHLELSEALAEKGVTSPRAVVMAVEKLAAGFSAEEAAQVDVSTNLNTYRICRNLIKGHWEDVAKEMKEANTEDAPAIRAAVASYLRTILLEEVDFSARARGVARGLEKLASIPGLESNLQLSATVGVLYSICRFFKAYSR